MLPEASFGVSDKTNPSSVFAKATTDKSPSAEFILSLSKGRTPRLSPLRPSGSGAQARRNKKGDL